MTNWRPEGWKTPTMIRVNPNSIGVQPITFLFEEEDAMIFESGADAMLDALRGKGHPPKLIATERVGISYDPLTGRYVQTGDVLGKGTWVFIPEG